MLVANARMYAVEATTTRRWRELFQWIAGCAGIDLEVIEHRPPAGLDELWMRRDLGAATMCGYPLATWNDGPRPEPLVAPVPSPEAFAGRAVYWTDIVVRADSRFERDDDLAGMRFGWTAERSQSGYQAPRRHFAARALARGGRFFGTVVGPLLTPRRVVESILDGSIDAGPLDAYWHALLRLHEPGTAARLRVVARTEDSPIPCLVSAHAIPQVQRGRLIQAFLDAAGASGLRVVLADLALAGFVRVTVDRYEVLAERAHATDALGYARLI